MNQSFFIFALLFISLSAKALEGINILEKNLFEKNQEFLALQMQMESKKALNSSLGSGYYPTLNIVGGLGQNQTDDRPIPEKGYLGYAEGRFNIYRGFKDQVINAQRNLDLQLIKLEIESKKRNLRSQLIEIASNIIFLHKLQSILEEENKVTQIQKKMAAKKVAAGLTGSVDNLEFELRENEIQIEQKQINQQHQEAHQNFVRLFGEDIADSKFEKLDFSSAEKLTKIADQINLENTLDYQKTELRLKQFDLEKKEIKSEFLPSLDFTYGVGRITPSEDSPMKFNEFRYALLLTVPLFSGFDTYYKIKAAALNYQSAEKLKVQTQNNIHSDFNITKIKILELSVLFQINEKKLVISQKYFDLTLAEYKRGIKNSPDLVGATERLFLSKKKKYELLKELEILKVRIENFS